MARGRKLGGRDFSDITIRASARQARESAFNACSAEYDDAAAQKACIRGVQRAIAELEKNLRIPILDGARRKRR